MFRMPCGRNKAEKDEEEEDEKKGGIENGPTRLGVGIGTNAYTNVV